MGKQVPAICHLAASREGGVLAAAEFEKLVHLYDLRTLERVRTLDTTHDFGGHRLAISGDGQTIIVGAYNIHGVAAYSGADGRELWRRKDLKKVQYIRFNTDDSRVFCCFDHRPCESLNVATGKSGTPRRGVRRIWESPFGRLRFLERSRDYAIADFEAPIASIARVSFAVLSAAFSPTLLCISEAAGPVRAFDVATGSEVWRCKPPAGHFLQVAFCEELRSFAGVCWPLRHDSSYLLQLFDSQSGAATGVAEIRLTAETEFCLRGSRLVTSAGSVFDVASGKRVAELPFPPDRLIGGAV